VVRFEDHPCSCLAVSFAPWDPQLLVFAEARFRVYVTGQLQTVFKRIHQLVTTTAVCVVHHTCADHCNMSAHACKEQERNDKTKKVGRQLNAACLQHACR